MRLGQIARKLDLKTTEIVSFLKQEHNIDVDNNLNTKLDDSTLELIQIEFNTEDSTSQELTEDEINDVNHVIEESIKETEDQQENEEEKSNDAAREDIVVVKEETNLEKSVNHFEDDTKAESDEIEINIVDGVIKAPKKELEGFKVVGKIELPEKKHKITFISTNNNNSENTTEDILSKKYSILEKRKQEKLEFRKRKQSKKKKHRPNKQSEIEKKQLEQEKAVLKQIENRKLDKQKKAEFYKKNIQAKTNISQVKKKQKHKQKDGDIKSVKTYDKEPTTRLGKIWKWFNT